MSNAVSLPNGSVIFIASAYGAVKTMLDISNANPGVATLETGHSVVADDILELTSGWPRLNNQVVRAGAVTGDDVELAGVNTSNTGDLFYPVGGGAGSVRKVTAWQSLVGVMAPTIEGGEQQEHTFQFWEDTFQRSIPTVKTPLRVSISLAEKPNNPGYALALTADEEKLPRAIKIALPNGVKFFVNAYVSASRMPSATVNEPMVQKISFALVTPPTRYES